MSQASPNVDATLMPETFDADPPAPSTVAPPVHDGTLMPPEPTDVEGQRTVQVSPTAGLDHPPGERTVSHHDATLMPPETQVPVDQISQASGTLCASDLDPRNQTPTQPMLARKSAPGRARPSTSGGKGGLGINIPGYEVLGELGRGGMGVVYKARHAKLKRLVALKMILSGAHAGAGAKARFLREAEAVAKLQHPNIIQIYEIGEADGNPFFSLEYIDGGALDGKLNGQPLHARQAAQLTHALALAMQAAHQKGMIHRDLKPANILLARGATHPDDAFPGLTPKITDFGLAKNIEDRDSNRTRDGEVMGTPSYMAPEQATGNVKEIGPTADVYALGAMLYEFLTGRPPFRAATAMETVMQVINEEPVPLRQLIAKLPRDLEIVCSRCLEKDAKKRYPSAQALADDLKHFLDGEPIHARPVPVWERSWRWARKHPTAAAMSLAGFFMLVALVVGLTWFNAHLQSVVTEALADAEQAREAEQEAVEGRRTADLRLQALAELQQGRNALTAKNGPAAQLALEKLLASIRDEERLADVREEAEGLLVEAKKLLSGAEKRRLAKEQMTRLARLRDDALFHNSAFTGMDALSAGRGIQRAAREALSLYGLGEGGKGFDVGPYVEPAEKEEIADGCYELLVVLAESVATMPAPISAVKKRQAEEALALLARAEKLGRTTRALERRKARRLEEAGRPDEAARAAATAEKMKPAGALDLFLTADESQRQGRWQDAAAELEQALRLKPDHFWAQYSLATCRLRQGKHAVARAHLTSCLGRRDFLWAYLLRGYACAEMLDFEAAESDYAAALERKPDALALYGLYVNRGLMRIRQKNLPGAVDDLRKAVALRPNDYQAHVNLARALENQGLKKDALVEVDRAVAIKSDMPALHRLRSALRRELGDGESALADLKQAATIEKSPTNLASDLVGAAKLHLEAKRFAEALASCEQALKVHPASLAAQRWKGEALLGLKRWTEAAEALDRYLERGQPVVEVLKARGLTRAKLGRHAEAVEDLTHALRLKPDAELYNARGWVHLVVESPKLAVHDFAQAIKLDPTSADAHNGRGFANARIGLSRDALIDAETALKLDAKTPRQVYNTARIHAQLAEKDNDPQRRQQALSLLEKALLLQGRSEREAFWNQFVLSDPAMLGLRSTVGFERLRESCGIR